MANFDSTLYTAQAAALTNGAEAPNWRNNSGPVHYVFAKVTLTSSTADNDLLRLCYLPKDARVVPAMSKVQCAADPGTTLTLDIGTSANTDAFADGIVLSSGGAVAFDSGSTAAEQAVTPAKLTDETLVYATVASANTITNGSVLTFHIAYTLG